MMLAEILNEGKKITQEAILGSCWHRRQEVTLELILKVTCKVIGVNQIAVAGVGRFIELVDARRFYSYFATKEGRWSLKDIGLMINRDHSTVIHANNRLSELLLLERNTMMTYNKINEILNR